MKPIAHTFKFGRDSVTLETGQVARQANGAVIVRVGDSVALVTVVSRKDAQPGVDFLPLSVNYLEKTYAAGKIPGGFFKREGRPSEKETLTSRLIDRPLRPLFPEKFFQDTQVVAQVLSTDALTDPDMLCMLGASAALAVSDVPFNGPVAGVRVGYINGEYIINPSFEELTRSELDLVVAGTENAVLMVESEAKELSEKVMLGAVECGHNHIKKIVEEVKFFAEKAAATKGVHQVAKIDHDLETQITADCLDQIKAAFSIPAKAERKEALDAIKNDLLAKYCCESDESAYDKKIVLEVFSALEKNVVRTAILEHGKRIDGRDTKTVRPITINAPFLPRTHGSALFTRGETQAIVTCTLGTERDSQIIDALEGERKDPFLLHYNFPPFCVGETGMVGAPKRREIGHGRLAKRALVNMLPDAKDFPYALRLVSEITESNGSSSMATVCGGSLALMDAGVPIKAPVAGIAMGLIKEGDKYAVLTDILGDEDHLGDMDFKVAGTLKGITALQMDIKIDGITTEIMEVALDQAKDGRLHILGEMNKALDCSRDLSEYAPRVTTFKIKADKVREVIGKGGATIRALVEEFGVTIDLDDDGTIKIGSVNKEQSEAARAKIELIVSEPEVGKVYTGKVARILEFGAIVNFMPGKDGLVHISEIANERVETVTDYVNEGDEVTVKLIEVDRQGRVRLSIKQAM